MCLFLFSSVVGLCFLFPLSLFQRVRVFRSGVIVVVVVGGGVVDFGDFDVYHDVGDQSAGC